MLVFSSKTTDFLCKEASQKPTKRKIQSCILLVSWMVHLQAVARKGNDSDVLHLNILCEADISYW